MWLIYAFSIAVVSNAYTRWQHYQVLDILLCCRSPSSWRFDVLSAQSCSSAYLCGNAGLFELLGYFELYGSAWTSLAILLWPLYKPFSPTELPFSLGCFFPPFSVNSRDCCAWKSQDITSFRDTQTTPYGTNNHSKVKLTLITFLPPFWWLVWTTNELDDVCILLCIEFQPHDWLIRYFH